MDHECDERTDGQTEPSLAIALSMAIQHSDSESSENGWIKVTVNKLSYMPAYSVEDRGIARGCIRIENGDI